MTLTEHNILRILVISQNQASGCWDITNFKKKTGGERHTAVVAAATYYKRVLLAIDIW
jgi:hypothetical protein